ncbi:MAG: fused MFS/spermidine synthase [Polaromonas sp.]|uniref:fused MFS/spermidine synthase n=1 Tax=Polaromonas sp. TaxID=1869339 RepID=UPI002732258C|nr:fused MFS/spermidine synthase [Polaromonas sp.]MDP1741300.1 fused MFS/spermidine synthase [Polaromonas sp.]MDP1955719.1 fused MFS/spermidine synthase [Polaromonas sp.]MDP3248349.1 fused MFS/spermidine synthase [Polaromonas sp.]MDP3752310.1 fused MFS/spermidine synthase [Polaromonas sp.]
MTAGPGDFQSLHYEQPFVREDGASKSLHFTLGELQSRMLTHQPWRLDVDYTRTMMGFLLFQPAPTHIGMIGLGGGSLAKFCYRQLPASRITVLENNPYVIALRRDFQIPDDDERLQVIAADGAQYLQREKPAFDVLLVDGFDHTGQPAALCSQRFYDDCLVALTDSGVLVVNLHADHPDYPLLAARISRSFSGNVLEIMAAEKSNGIVFARKGQALATRAISLQRSLQSLQPQAQRDLKPELARVSWEMSHRINHDTA